jgi:SAM domain (Sterile alpha motif)
MSDLRDWLRTNNLEQYADAFEANDIDLDILPDLDDHDLERLGLSLGNRRRLLKAMAARKAAATRFPPRTRLLCPTRLRPQLRRPPPAMPSGAK